MSPVTFTGTRALALPARLAGAATAARAPDGAAMAAIIAAAAVVVSTIFPSRWITWFLPPVGCQCPVKPGAGEREIAPCSLFRRVRRTRVRRASSGRAHVCSAGDSRRAQMYLAPRTFARQAGGMPPPLWDADGRLRHDALWRDAEQVLATRAMTRCSLAGCWIALAALTVPGYAWTARIPMLATSGVALLHASHTLV